MYLINEQQMEHIKRIERLYAHYADYVRELAFNPVTPGMDIYCPNGHKAGIVDLGDSVAMCIEGDCQITWEENGLEVSEWSGYELSTCFSTEELAKECSV